MKSRRKVSRVAALPPRFSQKNRLISRACTKHLVFESFGVRFCHEIRLVLSSGQVVNAPRFEILLGRWNRRQFMPRDLALWLGASEERYPQRSLTERATTPQSQRSGR